MSDNTPPCAGCGEYPGERIARLIQDQEATIRKQQAEIERLEKLASYIDPMNVPDEIADIVYAVLKGEGDE
jgi:uncharacterized protein YeeX (DUF496 family)